MNTSTSNSLVLRGLDGSNPLAFLAALGTLRVLKTANPEVGYKMRWIISSGRWTPSVLPYPPSCRIAGGNRENHFVNLIFSTLTGNEDSHPVLMWEHFLKGKERNYSKFIPSQASCDSLLDEKLFYISAIGSDAIPRKQTDNFDNQLRASRTDYFVGNLKNILRSTNKSHLSRSLFQDWDYGDPIANLSLRLDPSDDRRHAYQWCEPTTDPQRHRLGGMIGANRLAIEAIPFFQSVPVNSKIKTTGFSGFGRNDTRLTWPIWKTWISISVISSLLRFDELQSPIPNPRALQSMGITTVFRTYRLTVEKNRCFTPSSAII